MRGGGVTGFGKLRCEGVDGCGSSTVLSVWFFRLLRWGYRAGGMGAKGEVFDV